MARVIRLSKSVLLMSAILGCSQHARTPGGSMALSGLWFRVDDLNSEVRNNGVSIRIEHQSGTASLDISLPVVKERLSGLRLVCETDDCRFNSANGKTYFAIRIIDQWHFQVAHSPGLVRGAFGTTLDPEEGVPIFETNAWFAKKKH